MLNRKKIVYVVNVDWFFVSHRLPLAIEALKFENDVYLITRNTGRFEELEKLGIRCVDLKFDRSGRNPLKELLIVRQLTKMYSLIEPDIIHHVTLKPSLYGTIAARLCGSKSTIINAISGLGYVFTDNRKSLSKIFLLALMKLAFRSKRARFIFQNPDDMNFYSQLGFLTDSNNIIIKGSGVDESLFNASDIKIKAGKIKVVLVARMLRDKGIFEFVRAANALKEKYIDTLEFILVGGVDAFNPAGISEEILNEICDGHYIMWVGHQDNVREIYQNADIVCLPSYREGLPKSLVEAMACGCPIITTDAIGCRECVEEGVNGYLVPIGDHILMAERIEKLLANVELRLAMGENSRKKMIAEMSLKKVVEMTCNFYE